MFKKILLGIVLNGIALFAVTEILKDVQYTGGFMFFIMGGFIIGFLNIFVKPLMKVLSFPFMIMTVGLFSLVINAIIFWLTTRIVNGINFADVSVTISSTWTYLIAGVMFGLVNWVIHIFIRNK